MQLSSPVWPVGVGPGGGKPYHGRGRPRHSPGLAVWPRHSPGWPAGTGLSHRKQDHGWSRQRLEDFPRNGGCGEALGGWP